MVGIGVDQSESRDGEKKRERAAEEACRAAAF
jgi:hypothetical protein